MSGRVHLATDHAGYEFSKGLLNFLADEHYQVVHHGAVNCDPEDDYPSFCIAAAEAVVRDITDGIPSLGVVIGGSGNGEQIAANKVKGARAALAWSECTARLARAHNNANVVAIGARMHAHNEGFRIVLAFLREPFSEDSRHIRRIDAISSYECQS